ncbi:MAG: hypothetical protein ABSF26_31170 [Thermoguttaceae bacterium]
MRNLKRSFRRRSSGRRPAPRANSRLLRIEPLEGRSLLSHLTLSGTVSVSGLAVASGNVPVSNAALDVYYAGYEREVFTSVTGAFQVTIPNQFQGELVGFTAVARSRQINLRPGASTKQLATFAVYPSGQSAPASPTPWAWGVTTDAPNMVYTVTATNAGCQDANGTFNIVLDAGAIGTEAQAAGAMAILSIMQPYAQYAAGNLGASLPGQIGAVYPDDSGGTSFYSPGPRGDGMIHIDPDSLDGYPDVVGHEMGHLVAAANGFANQGDGRNHSPKNNMREGAVCTLVDAQDAFCEGYADYFCVAAKNANGWLQIKPANRPPVNNYLHIPRITFGNKTYFGRAIDPAIPAFGEDAEGSVADTLWLLDTTGQDDHDGVTGRVIPPQTARGLFEQLGGKEVLADLWGGLVAKYPGDASEATLGHLFQLTGVSPTVLSVNPQNRTVVFTTPLVCQNGNFTGQPTFPATVGSPPDQQAELIVAVDGPGWQPVYRDNPYPPDASGLPSVAGQVDGQVYKWTETLSLPTWNLIAAGHGCYWVVEAVACDVGTPIWYWSAAKKFRAQPTPAAAKPVTATEGVPCTAAVATIDDVGGADDAAGLSATIRWGDRRPSTTVTTTASDGGQIVPDGADDGGYDIDATHTYAEYGPYADQVFIDDGRVQFAALDAPVTVVDASLTVAPVTGLGAVEGQQFNGCVATLTDAGGGPWGDGGRTKYGAHTPMQRRARIRSSPRWPTWAGLRPATPARPRR